MNVTLPKYIRQFITQYTLRISNKVSKKRLWETQKLIDARRYIYIEGSGVWCLDYTVRSTGSWSSWAA